MIEAQGGIIDQFIGDGLMVLFGAIPPRRDHASAAIRAALAVIRVIDDNRMDWKSHGFESLRVGVGIHTGTVLLGAIGSRTRLDFTAIGDTVNAASRIEGENKRIGSNILITAATRDNVPAAERRELGIRDDALAATVKGKQIALSLHIVDSPGTGHLSSRSASGLAGAGLTRN